MTLPLEVMNKTTTKFPQILIITEQGLIGMSFLNKDFYPAVLSKGTTNETFLQSGKQDSIKHILKKSDNMY